MKPPIKGKKIICGPKNDSEHNKCGGCNWETQTFYAFKGEKLEDEGLCASCFLDVLINGNAKIII